MQVVLRFVVNKHDPSWNSNTKQQKIIKASHIGLAEHSNKESLTHLAVLRLYQSWKECEIVNPHGKEVRWKNILEGRLCIYWLHKQCFFLLGKFFLMFFMFGRWYHVYLMFWMCDKDLGLIFIRDFYLPEHDTTFY